MDFADEVKEITGVRVGSINRKGAEILFVSSADYFGSPHWYTFLGYLPSFTKSVSTIPGALMPRRREFRFLSFAELAKRLNAKIYMKPSGWE
jgi:hypothetical protein